MSPRMHSGILPQLVAGLTPRAAPILRPRGFREARPAPRSASRSPTTDLLEVLRLAVPARSRGGYARHARARASSVRSTAPAVLARETRWTGGPFARESGCDSSTRAMLARQCRPELDRRLPTDELFGILRGAPGGARSRFEVLDQRATWQDRRPTTRKAEEH